MSNYRNRIGEAIAFARNVAGRSQQELADMLGRDKRTIQKWERRSTNLKPTLLTSSSSLTPTLP